MSDKPRVLFSSICTHAPLYASRVLWTKSIQEWIQFIESVCLSVALHPVCVGDEPWCWSLSVLCVTAPRLPNLVFKMSSYYPGVSGRERERVKEKLSGGGRDCHSKFIYILQCVRPVIPTQSTYYRAFGPHKQISYSLCCHASFEHYPS